MTPTTSTTDPLSYALAYAALGWRVVPIRPGEKRPALPDWVREATADPELIAQWWARWPDHGIGLVTGPESGVFALDVDPRHGGDDTLADLEASYEPLPETVEAITGGGGRHLLFRWPALDEGQRLANSAGRLGPGLDVRASGGQIVVAPSIHPETGNAYAWEVGHLPGTTELAEAPGWLLALLLEDAVVLPEGQVDAEGDWDYARDRFDLGEGWQGRAVALLERHGWHSPRTDRGGVTYLTRPGKAPHEGSGASVGKIPGVTYVFTDGGPPLGQGGYRNHRLLEVLEHGGDALAADRAMIAEVGGAPSVVPPAELEAWVRGLRMEKALGVAHDALREARAFLAEPDPEYDWLVPGLLERGDRLILTGAEGMGKSTLLRQLGAQMAAGIHPFTGEDVPPVRVVIIDLENSARHLRRKLRGLVEVAGPALAEGFLFVVPKAEGIDLGTAADIEWLQAIARASRPDVLIIGPIYKMSNGDPTEETTAKPIVSILDRVRVDHDCAIVVEAHTPQESGGGKRPERPYGASLWRRWPEFGIFLDPSGALRHWRGARDEREWPNALERGGSSGWPWVLAAGRDVTFQAMLDIQASAAKPMSYREIADAMRAQGHPTASKSSVARAVSANRKQWDALLSERGWPCG